MVKVNIGTFHYDQKAFFTIRCLLFESWTLHGKN